MNTLKSLLAAPLAAFAIAAALLCSPHASAATVYDNTSTDTLNTYIYSALGAQQIGDVVTLAGTERLLTDVSVQFFNLSTTAGSFDATLRFYDSTVPVPVGAQIGASYTSTAIAIGGLDIRTVTFTGLNLVVPDSIVFTVQVLNAGTLDLGLNAFEPPTLGSSDNATLVWGNPGSLAVGLAGAGTGNLYFQANAVPVPEPSTLWMGALGVLALLHRTRRHNRMAVQH